MDSFFINRACSWFSIQDFELEITLSLPRANLDQNGGNRQYLPYMNLLHGEAQKEKNVKRSLSFDGLGLFGFNEKEAARSTGLAKAKRLPKESTEVRQLFFLRF